MGNNIIVDALTGLVGCGNVQRHNVASLKQVVSVFCGMNILRLNLVGWHKLVESINLHAESFSDAGYIATNIAKSEYAELFAFELRASFAIEEIAHGVNEHTENEFCHCVRVLPRSVLYHYAFFLGVCGVDRVVACSGTNHNFQSRSSIKHFFGYFIGTHNHCVRVLDSIQQLLLVGVFLQQHQLVSFSLCRVLDAIYRCGGKWLFCCNKYLHS